MRRKLKTAALSLVTVLLFFTASAVIVVDVLLSDIYTTQKENREIAAQATPIPVTRATPRPAVTAAPTPMQKPVRTPLPGDLPVNFPDYDTGVYADYSYQSDELRVAVHKIQETGVTYYVADVWMRNINCFRTAFSSGEFRGRRQNAETISQDNNAVLGVNGDFLGGLVIRNGVLYRKATLRPVEEADASATPTPTPTPGIPTPTPTPTPSSRPERATCVLYADGRIVTSEFRSFQTDTAMDNGAWQGWQFGPTLVREGEPAQDVKAQGRNPRCMIGFYEPGHYCLVLIDGRKKGYSVGMNYQEMIDLAMRLGFREAYNLDGGASAIMTFDGKIINQPAGSSETRSLPDMIVIGDYLAP